MTSSLGDIVNGKLTVINDNQSSSVDLDLLAPFTSGDAIQVVENLTILQAMYLKIFNMNTMSLFCEDYNTDGFIDLLT